MAYWYSAYTIDKRIVQGTIDAVSERMAEEALYRAGYNRVLKLRETRPGLDLGKLMPTFFGVKTPDVIDFSHQLATLVESGIPILTALQLLEEQAPTAALRKIIAGLARELQEGNSLSQALAGYPQVFSNTYCQVIKASEQAGRLEAGLRQMASYMEKRAAVEQKITYKRELRPGDVITIRSGLLEMQEKVIRFYHEMRNEETGEVAATTILTAVHIDAEERKSCPFPPEMLERGRKMAVDHRLKE